MRRRACSSAALLLAALAQSALAETRVPVLERRLERPAAMAGQHNQVSYVQRSLFWPVGTNAIEFDYYVDSEAGHDYLRVYVGDMVNPAWSMSGLNRAGRKRLPVPGNGPVKVRFAYVKDGSGSQGTDTAWVDDVAAFSSGGSGRMEMHRFDSRKLAVVPQGWAGGGFAGGWSVSHPGSRRSAARPVGQQGLDGSSSYMERAFTWAPGKGALEFDYFVDSQEQRDFLNVYVWPAANPVPAAPTWSASGRNRAGHARLPVTSGAKKVRFEYRKDASESHGLDTARVDRVEFRNGLGGTDEVHDFTGREPGKVPIRVGNGPAEWTSGGAAGGWRVVRATPNTTYVPAQQVGGAAEPSWSPFAEPVVDGTITSPDLVNPTHFAVLDYGNPAYDLAHVALVESADTSTLFLLVRLQGLGSAAGSESGKVTVFLDGGRGKTLRGLGCPAQPARPGNEDRRISFGYDIAVGESLATLSAAGQTRGDCSGGFVALGSQAVWDWEAVVSEPADDAGFVHLEMKIVLPAAVAGEGSLGLGFLHASSQPAGSRVRFPFVDDGAGPVESDVGSWETISLVYKAGDPDLSENPFPACCYPEPSQPSVKVW